MKLVELLARELDVWPEEATHAIQEDTGTVEFTEKGKPGIKEGSWSVLANNADGPCLWLLGAGVNVTMLATDHATAIITRSDWQAERERIAGGWIAWGGGECPVDRTEFVEVKYRDGTVPRYDESYCWTWAHDGNDDDIIAYRLHKPEQQQPQQEQEEMTPCEKLGYKVGDLFVFNGSMMFSDGEEARLIDDDCTDCPKFKSESRAVEYYAEIRFARKVAAQTSIETTNSDDPRTMRDSILEIDRTTEALEEERGQLVQRLADEGFSLLQVVAQSDPVEDMSDWRNWREGDLLTVVSAAKSDPFIAGDIVELVEAKYNKSLAYVKNGNESGWNMTVEEVKFHSRPTA